LREVWNSPDSDPDIDRNPLIQRARRGGSYPYPIVCPAWSRFVQRKDSTIDNNDKRQAQDRFFRHDSSGCRGQAENIESEPAGLNEAPDFISSIKSKNATESTENSADTIPWRLRMQKSERALSL